MNHPRSELPALLPASVLAEGTERYDVVVIGFGIAGASAALEAARAGARVLLLERAAVHGGTTCMAGGHFYLGGGTAVQQATGHEDSAEEMYKYLVAVSKDPEHDKIRAYCDGSVEHFGWLESLGFEFERSYFPGKAVIQPGTEGLMFTGLIVNSRGMRFVAEDSYHAGHRSSCWNRAAPRPTSSSTARTWRSPRCRWCRSSTA